MCVCACGRVGKGELRREIEEENNDDGGGGGVKDK
jgi:hypothetical protein